MIGSQKFSVFLDTDKFYKSQSQYFPTNNIILLESEAFLLDLASRKNAPFQ